MHPLKFNVRIRILSKNIRVTDVKQCTKAVGFMNAAQ